MYAPERNAPCSGVLGRLACVYVTSTFAAAHAAAMLCMTFLLQGEVSAAYNALTKLGGKLTAVERVESWSPEGQRTAVVVTKTSSTPSRFPRSPGTPGRKAL